MLVQAIQQHVDQCLRSWGMRRTSHVEIESALETTGGSHWLFPGNNTCAVKDTKWASPSNCQWLDATRSWSRHVMTSVVLPLACPDEHQIDQFDQQAAAKNPICCRIQLLCCGLCDEVWFQGDGRSDSSQWHAKNSRISARFHNHEWVSQFHAPFPKVSSHLSSFN